jgi:hypothetical protein
LNFNLTYEEYYDVAVGASIAVKRKFFRNRMILGRDFFANFSRSWCGLLEPTAAGVIRDPELRAWSVWPNLTKED